MQCNASISKDKLNDHGDFTVIIRRGDCTGLHPRSAEKCIDNALKHV